MKRLTIEQERGETYHKETFAVYEYSRYGKSSVLAGMERRRYLDGGFKSIEEAQAKFPAAKPSGSGFVPMSEIVRHLPDDADGAW